MEIKRNQIYYADLSPVKGSEQGGLRPVLILQNDIGNKYSPTIIMAPITTKVGQKAKLPTHIKLDTKCNLPRDSMVLLEQIRCIDKSRLRNYVGTITAVDVQRVNDGICISLAVE